MQVSQRLFINHQRDSVPKRSIHYYRQHSLISSPPKHTESSAGLTGHSKKLWHSSCTVETRLLYFHPTNTVRGSNVWFVFPLFLHSQCCSPTFMCFSVHNSRSVLIYCDIQAGSKAMTIINPLRGKHSSRYCGTFPAVYGITWDSFLTATSPGESLVSECYCCPFAFYVLWGIARSCTLIKQLLQNEGRPLTRFFLLQGEGSQTSQLISWIGVTQQL